MVLCLNSNIPAVLQMSQQQNRESKLCGPLVKPKKQRLSIKTERDFLTSLLKRGEATVVDAKLLKKNTKSAVWSNFGAIRLSDNFSHATIDLESIVDQGKIMQLCKQFVACYDCFAVFKYDGHAYGTTGLLKHIKLCTKTPCLGTAATSTPPTTVANHNNNNNNNNNTNNTNINNVNNTNTTNNKAPKKRKQKSEPVTPPKVKRPRRSIKADRDYLTGLLNNGSAKVVDAKHLRKNIKSPVWSHYGAISLGTNVTNPAIDVESNVDDGKIMQICKNFVACNDCFTVFKYDGHAYGTTGLVKHIKLCPKSPANRNQADTKAENNQAQNNQAQQQQTDQENAGQDQTIAILQAQDGISEEQISAEGDGTIMVIVYEDTNEGVVMSA